MDDIATAQSENENLRRIRGRLMRWESRDDALAQFNVQQQECLEALTNSWQQEIETKTIDDIATMSLNSASNGISHIADKDLMASNSIRELLSLCSGIDNTAAFLIWFDRIHAEMDQHADGVYYQYLQQLEAHSQGCRHILQRIDKAVEILETLKTEYAFVSLKTSSLNTASEKLIAEYEKLQQLGEEIQHRLGYFNRVEWLQQRLQSPTLSVASEAFRECLNHIDQCLEYLRANPKFKDSAAFIIKYRHCLSKAVTLMKNFVSTVMAQATEATLRPKQHQQSVANAAATGANSGGSSRDAVFALYYGKYQTFAAKVRRISELVEARVQISPEYEQLLVEMQQNYLNERAVVISPAVDKAIKDLKTLHKGDHCSLIRSACTFLVNVCQDEHRLFLQFFVSPSEQLTIYLEGLCTLLYDAMRPFIIHVNHLETLAEICSILRIEMIEEHVQQNPEVLDAFDTTANQLLQDVQERLVFRAHLYLQSDILHYNPSAGDLAYPEKLEMMESIALSLQEGQQQHMRRSDSRSSLLSTASSAMETESVDTSASRMKNSPADLHGMWYPTVRRTLVCLSRLYRCVDRPIFQGLSQEALKLCIQSISIAAKRISAAKSPIDGELFEIKHLLILREQIAPFRVDFTAKETSLDFSKVKTAAFGLLQRRKQLFSMGSNNALLEFLLDGTPQVKEHLLDSRKEVDRQLKTVCEQFIKNAAHMLVGPIATFLDKANALLAGETKASESSSLAGKEATPIKANYTLRQSPWASPQQISGVIQETQRVIKSKLSPLQRSMQLYLSNRDTEFIIFRPIRNNIIQVFVKLEQLLTTNEYTADDMIITGCPSAEQVSILLSSTSILATENIVNFTAAGRKISTSMDGSGGGGGGVGGAGAATVSAQRKMSFDKKMVTFEQPHATTTTTMENVTEASPDNGDRSKATTATEETSLPSEIEENTQVVAEEAS